MTDFPTRCGFVALVGRPNVGKSTLTNRLVGQKVSIISARPQTTRHRILGIRSDDESQIIFVDTPGLHQREQHSLNRYMNRAARSAASDADLVIFVVEAGRWTEQDEAVLLALEKVSAPVAAIINKVDLHTDKTTLLPYLAEFGARREFKFIMPLSAKRERNLEPLLNEVRGLLPEGPFMFPTDQVTDRSERFMTAETIREKLLRNLNQELPYACTVEIEYFRQQEDRIEVGAVIWVARDSHKGIVIGKGGEMLKRVGTRARQDLAAQFGQRVHLETWVKVRENWQDDQRALRAFGYDEK